MTQRPRLVPSFDRQFQRASDLALDSLALIRTIEAAGLLTDAPASRPGRMRHSLAVSLLHILERELLDLADELSEPVCAGTA